MLRVVPDTNVLISALGWGGNEYTFMEKCFRKEVLLVMSPDILAEFREAALEPSLKFGSEDVDAFTDALIEAALIVHPTEKLSACRDPDDNKFLEAAVEGKAEFIVSGDRDLLALKKFRDVEVMTAPKFMAQRK